MPEAGLKRSVLLAAALIFCASGQTPPASPPPSPPPEAAETASPSASPSPGASASPAAAASPAASPTPPPIVVRPENIAVAVGSTQRLTVESVLGPIAAEVKDPSVVDAMI
ncbi:MAG: hypothetical protein JO199_10145, partial [Candidatus Eremiobacteraeota bacterium]|nr:hypothetical protein [Candidatus Eremiobacteraeota bacterium]